MEKGIGEMIEEGRYENKLPYGEGKDKEEKKECNKKYREEDDRLYLLFEDDCRKYVNAYCKEITERRFKLIFNKSWSDGHAEGYSEVWYHFEEILEFAKNMEMF